MNSDSTEDENILYPITNFRDTFLVHFSTKYRVYNSHIIFNEDGCFIQSNIQIYIIYCT